MLHSYQWPTCLSYMADRGSVAWEIGAGQRFGDFLFISCLFFIPTEEKMWRRGRNPEAESPYIKEHHMLGEGWEKAWGRGTSKEAEVVRVVAGCLGWDRVTEGKGGENLIKEDLATSVKYLREARRMVGRRNWIKLSLSELSLSMAYSGQPDRELRFRSLADVGTHGYGTCRHPARERLSPHQRRDSEHEASLFTLLTNHRPG